MADDDVQLTDLEVIQRYSLAVRGASASRSELVAALQADLDWLQGGRRAAAKTTKAPARATGTSAGDAAGDTAAVKAPAKKATKATAAKRRA